LKRAKQTSFSSLQRELNLAEQRLASLKKEQSAEHPEVLKAASQVLDLQSQIKRRAEEVLAGLGAKVILLKQEVSKLDGEAAERTQGNLEKNRQIRPYLDAQRKLEELRVFSQMLETNIAALQSQIAESKASPMEIVDRAAPVPGRSSRHGPAATALVVSGFVVGLLGILVCRRSWPQFLLL
jgi:uncharacterized protein involved in exopolysaccharide biosynthesis